VSERARTDLSYYNEGYRSQRIVEYIIKSLSDYDVVRFIIEDAVYHEDYTGFVRARERLGEDGLLLANMGRCPLQRMSIELAGLERLALDLHDYPEVVEGLLQTMEQRQDEVYRMAAESPAELIWSPDNVSTTRMSPRWFERYCLPFYNRHGPMVHRAGKMYVAHMDGRLRGLKHLIAQCDLDVIEAVTPPPMGDLPIAEAQAAWPDKSVWCNFPESLFAEGNCAVFDHTLDLLRQAYSRGHFVLGVTEDMPEDYLETGLSAIAQAIEKYESEEETLYMGGQG